ncbi:hypothetical protein Tco_0587694 [Tanacetum coccineum]
MVKHAWGRGCAPATPAVESLPSPRVRHPPKVWPHISPQSPAAIFPAWSLGLQGHPSTPRSPPSSLTIWVFPAGNAPPPHPQDSCLGPSAACCLLSRVSGVVCMSRAISRPDSPWPHISPPISSLSLRGALAPYLSTIRRSLLHLRASRILNDQPFSPRVNMLPFW